MKRRGVIIGVVLLIPFLSGGLIGLGIGKAVEKGEAPGSVSVDDGAPYQEAETAMYRAEQRDSISDAVHDSRRNAITRTVASCSPAIVGINVIEVQTVRYSSPWGDDPFFRQFFGDQTYTQKVEGLGSGFLISSDGYILTNDHVAGNAKEITVTLTNGSKYNAKLVGTDKVADIALLKIDGKDLPFLKLGNSDDVIIGEWVIAFGNPFGLFDISDKPTVTVGVVSATKMNLRSQEGRAYRGMIQTDAAINSGNSGGPLVNSLGEVIGVNAVIFTPNQGSIGLGFAIPINRVKTVVAGLKKSGKVERQYWTGLEIQAVDARVARYFGLKTVQGVIISDIQRGSPAERAGLRVGDIILSVNGERVDDEESMLSIVEDATVGDILAMKILRDRNPMTIKMKLERRPS